jgi:hypothetical protein
MLNLLTILTAPNAKSSGPALTMKKAIPYCTNPFEQLPARILIGLILVSKSIPRVVCYLFYGDMRNALSVWAIARKVLLISYAFAKS